MQLASEFLLKFQEGLLDKNSEQIMALNMKDDITGWGLYQQDDYNGADYLLKNCQGRNSKIESGMVEFEPLDVFGNGQALVIICKANRTIILKNGEIVELNQRWTFYLVEHEGQFKIRHTHLSLGWSQGQAFPSNPIPERTQWGTPETIVRLDTASTGPFVELLNKRTAYTASANLEGLLGLHHQSNSNVYWQLHPTPLRGIGQYRNHLLYLKEKYKEPTLKFQQPVIFKNNSLACMSTYCKATYVDVSGARHSISPLRVTYILQEIDNQWLCRHSHWSLPLENKIS